MASLWLRCPTCPEHDDAQCSLISSIVHFSSRPLGLGHDPDARGLRSIFAAEEERLRGPMLRALQNSKKAKSSTPAASSAAGRRLRFRYQPSVQVRMPQLKHALHLQRSAALGFSEFGAELWMWSETEFSADHIQKESTNLAETTPATHIE